MINNFFEMFKSFSFYLNRYYLLIKYTFKSFLKEKLLIIIVALAIGVEIGVYIGYRSAAKNLVDFYNNFKQQTNTAKYYSLIDFPDKRISDKTDLTYQEWLSTNAGNAQSSYNIDNDNYGSLGDYIKQYIRPLSINNTSQKIPKIKKNSFLDKWVGNKNFTSLMKNLEFDLRSVIGCTDENAVTVILTDSILSNNQSYADKWTINKNRNVLSKNSNIEDDNNNVYSIYVSKKWAQIHKLKIDSSYNLFGFKTKIIGYTENINSIGFSNVINGKLPTPVNANKANAIIAGGNLVYKIERAFLNSNTIHSMDKVSAILTKYKDPNGMTLGKFLNYDNEKNALDFLWKAITSSYDYTNDEQKYNETIPNINLVSVDYNSYIWFTNNSFTVNNVNTFSSILFWGLFPVLLLTIGVLCIFISRDYVTKKRYQYAMLIANGYSKIYILSTLFVFPIITVSIGSLLGIIIGIPLSTILINIFNTNLNMLIINYSLHFILLFLPIFLSFTIVLTMITLFSYYLFKKPIIQLIKTDKTDNGTKISKAISVLFPKTPILFRVGLINIFTKPFLTTIFIIIFIVIGFSTLSTLSIENLMKEQIGEVNISGIANYIKINENNLVQGTDNKFVNIGKFLPTNDKSENSWFNNNGTKINLSNESLKEFFNISESKILGNNAYITQDMLLNFINSNYSDKPTLFNKINELVKQLAPLNIRDDYKWVFSNLYQCALGKLKYLVRGICPYDNSKSTPMIVIPSRTILNNPQTYLFNISSNIANTNNVITQDKINQYKEKKISILKNPKFNNDSIEKEFIINIPAIVSTTFYGNIKESGKQYYDITNYINKLIIKTGNKIQNNIDYRIIPSVVTRNDTVMSIYLNTNLVNKKTLTSIFKKLNITLPEWINNIPDNFDKYDNILVSKNKSEFLENIGVVPYNDNSNISKKSFKDFKQQIIYVKDSIDNTLNMIYPLFALVIILVWIIILLSLLITVVVLKFHIRINKTYISLFKALGSNYFGIATGYIWQFLLFIFIGFIISVPFSEFIYSNVKKVVASFFEKGYRHSTFSFNEYIFSNITIFFGAIFMICILIFMWYMVKLAINKVKPTTCFGKE